MVTEEVPPEYVGNTLTFDGNPRYFEVVKKQWVDALLSVIWTSREDPWDFPGMYDTLSCSSRNLLCCYQVQVYCLRTKKKHQLHNQMSLHCGSPLPLK